MMEPQKSFGNLLQGLRAGDSRAEYAFWQHYGPLLEELAQKHLHGGVLRRLGPEDVAQSACRTFLRRAQLGQYEVPDAASLWHLLCTITLSKVHEQARFHRRQRRNVNQEQIPAPHPEENDRDLGGPVDQTPGPDEAAAFADQFQQLIAGLEPEERKVVELKLQDLSNEEIAQRLRSSERTVRRILARLRGRFERALLG
jgi:RNA polymerase sigma-70 factor (ECF subfamily)